MNRMETTTTQPVPHDFDQTQLNTIPAVPSRQLSTQNTENSQSTSSAEPAQVRRDPAELVLRAGLFPATSFSIVISGAQRACDLEPRVLPTCNRSVHAPARASSAYPANWTPSEREGNESTLTELPEPGAEVWQELVRMLIAREAAKSSHPAGRGRN